MATHEPFSLGSVVVPARDGALERLGYDVGSLGDRALGVVVEAKPAKALVYFPALKLTVWIPHDEMADVDARADAGEADFARLRPDAQASLSSTTPLVWWLREFARLLPLTHVLGTEEGVLGDIWPDNENTLREYTDASLTQNVAYFGLGVPEFKLAQWDQLRARAGDALLFGRFLPSGMHKLEIAVYLKR